MINYYSVNACRPCRESEQLYKAAHEYCRRNKRLDLKTISLTTTKALQEYNQNVKPYRNGRESLPMVFDDETKQELVSDGKGSLRPRKVLQRNQQEAEEPNVSGRRREDSAQAESSSTKELAPES